MSGKNIRFLAVFIGTIYCLCGCGGGEKNQQSTDSGNTEAKMPFFREDYETMTYNDEEYKEALSRPYWLGNVLYNETAIPFSRDGEICASLLYKPERVIRVMDQTLSVVYEEGKDYIVDKENKRLTIPSGSSISALSPLVAEAQEIPDGYEKISGGSATENKYQVWNSGGKGNFVYTEGPLFYGKYLSVTYAYDIEELSGNSFNRYDEYYLPTVRAKLRAGENITLGVLGDSISAGCSSTGDVLHVLPNTPGYVNQLKTEIERVYGVNVEVKSGARGGTTSGWLLTEDGKSSLKTVRDACPDLCVIAYGMNDGAPNPVNYGEAFGENISALMTRIKMASPTCEFILVNSFPCNELYKRQNGIFDEYLEALSFLESEGGGSVKTVDMQSVGLDFLSVKRYCEIASNNVNHPNDFMHRVYAMNIMTALYDYKNE